MAKTIIFLSGMGVPNFLSKSKYVWNDKLWADYQTIYLHSEIPMSDKMVNLNIKKLISFINKFPDCIVAGQSLGGWWAANLACEPACQMKKFILLTPLVDANQFSIFNVSKIYNPLNRVPNDRHIGTNKSLVLSAIDDLIVPPREHAAPIAQYFKSTYHSLYGGHFWQSNHAESLAYTKKWIELG